MRESSYFGKVRRGLKCLTSVGVFAALGGLSHEALAKPGTHPIVVSTWDARASSVVLQYRHGSLDGGAFNVVSYHANFSSTGGRLSSQFGLYYENFSELSGPTAHGLAGSATAVFNLPVTRRLDNGLPVAAIDLYLGSAPTALVSGERNYLTLPLVLGFGVPVTPARAITLTPWFEFSPSVNLDTVIHPFDFSNENPLDYIDPKTNEIKLTTSDVERVLAKSVELKTSVAVGARAGLDLNLHVSDYFDFTANATLSSVGTAFSGTRVLYLGGGFVWRWDDIVPAVLPPEKRLLNESCDDIEQRFRACPNSRKWRSPEEQQRLYGPTNIAPNRAPTATTPAKPPASSPVVPPAPVAPPASGVVPNPTLSPAPTPPPAPPAAAPPSSDLGGGSNPSGAFPATP